MKFIDGGENIVGGIAKERNQAGELILSWRNINCALYLVLYAESREKVNLHRSESWRQLIAENCGQLAVGETFEIRPHGIECSLFSYSELIRNGGKKISEKPGFYAVYGAERNGDLLVYIDSRNAPLSNILTMTVEVSVRTAPLMLKKGFLKKKIKYSGYRKISVEKGHAELHGSDLHYKVHGFTYAFPESVAKNGGTFFVKADAEARLLLGSDNPSINIQTAASE